MIGYLEESWLFEAISETYIPLLSSFFKYLSDSGIYPHSGSHIPLGFLPRYFLYIDTPTAICVSTAFSLEYIIGKYPVCSTTCNYF